MHTWRNDPAAPRHSTVDDSPALEATQPAFSSLNVLALCLPLSQSSRRARVTWQPAGTYPLHTSHP